MIWERFTRELRGQFVFVPTREVQWYVIMPADNLYPPYLNLPQEHHRTQLTQWDKEGEPIRHRRPDNQNKNRQTTHIDRIRQDYV